MRRRALLLAALATPALAQEWPSRPLRLASPYPPGGLTDVMLRLLQEPLRTALGVPVVIENRPGAAGAIAMRDLANSAPDGTLLVLANNGPASIVPAMRADAGYEALRSFTPVSLLATQPLIVLGATQLPVRDLAGLIAHARAHPGELNFASGGIGSLGHLAGALLASQAGMRVVHVPYQGAAPTLTAVLGNQVQFAVTSYNGGVGENAAAGRLRILAVTSPEPWPAIPQVPVAAAAVPGFQAEAWFGLLGPAGMPAPVVARLNAEISRALALPAVRDQFLAAGLKLVGGPPARLHDVIAAEVPVWTRLIRESGIRAE